MTGRELSERLASGLISRSCGRLLATLNQDRSKRLAATTAAMLRSMSSAVVFQPLTLTRTATRVLQQGRPALQSGLDIGTRRHHLGKLPSWRPGTSPARPQSGSKPGGGPSCGPSAGSKAAA
jgi:hypothetical protein